MCSQVLAFSREGEYFRSVAGRKTESRASPTALPASADLGLVGVVFCLFGVFFWWGVLSVKELLQS